MQLSKIRSGAMVFSCKYCVRSGSKANQKDDFGAVRPRYRGHRLRRVTRRPNCESWAGRGGSRALRGLPVLEATHSPAFWRCRRREMYVGKRDGETEVGVTGALRGNPCAPGQRLHKWRHATLMPCWGCPRGRLSPGPRWAHWSPRFGPRKWLWRRAEGFSQLRTGSN